MTADSNYIVVGKIGSTYGIKGWLKVISYTSPVAGILDYKLWYLEDTLHWKPIEISTGREHGKGIVVHFDGYETPEKARLLTGKKIAITRAQLPKLTQQEYYWADLEGLTVINDTGEELGKVIYLMETGSNDVLVVKGEKEIAIPYLPGEVILSIDLEKQIMQVKWDMI
ncbi:MAG: ribosome maturation factor RimM [Gammaproteobacteria bacterium]|nr:ribosome maturation factor RimM [Gammaproteobacteria bacterium]